MSSNNVKSNGNYYHSILEPLFFEVLNTPIDERNKEFQNEPWKLVPFLNGGLFTDHEDDYYGKNTDERAQLLNTLIVPNKWLKNLLEVFETYNFTIDENTPVDVELSIEPEMLGRIFENLLAEINPETGETARKVTGSYYTPRPIVEYMVDESLKQYLLANTSVSETEVTSLLSYTDEEPGLMDSQKDAVLNVLDTIKVIDPACGSGAFPMGILQKILLILRKIDPDSKKWLGKILAKIDDPIVRKEFETKLKRETLEYVHKLGIIRDAIYGVDIQPIAVEISKLRCFLSLILDETIDDTQPNRAVEPLPNLEFKFVCANTLLGLPRFKDQQTMFEANKEIAELRNLRSEYLNSYGEEKIRIEKKFRQIQSRMFDHSINWEGRDSQTLKLSQWDPFSEEPCGWFDPEWMFGITQGFDIVIANPPYIQIKQIPWDDRKVYETKFKSAVGRFNLFYFFIELTCQLAKFGSMSTFIVPDRLLLNTQCHKLRKWLLEEQTIIEIDSFDESVFDSSVVDSIIIFYLNLQSRYSMVKAKDKISQDNLTKINSKEIPTKYFIESPNSQFDLGYNPSIAKVIDKIRHRAINLGEIAEIKDGIIQGKVADKLFLDKPLDDDSKPLLFGEDVTKYSIRFNNNWVNYKPTEMMRLEVKRRGPGVRHGLWMRTTEIFERNKILTRQTADEIIGAYDTKDFYYSNTLHGTTVTDKSYDPLYVIGLLNSRLMTWYYRSTTAEKGKVFAQIKIELLRLLPICKASMNEQKPLIDTVEKILAVTKDSDYIHSHAKQAKVKELEKQIDQMVYKLYGLTKEEIAIVENSGN